MKFGQELLDNIYEPWRLEYVAYNDIKSDLLNRQQHHVWNDYDERDFEVTMRMEADKVNQFISRKQREVDSRLAYCERTLLQQDKNTSPEVAKNLYDSTDDALTEILMDINDLSKFTRYNFLAIQKLTKKHDKYTNFDAQPLFVDIIRTTSLDRQRFDVALVKVSTLHDLCRLHGEVRSGNAAAGLDQNAFERATAKYWIHPDNVTELKAILLFHLPVLLFNPQKPIEPEDSAISSVYFDNPDFELYQGRLQRDEGAEAIRFRWYGPMESNSIFIERKTHHASWLDGASVKDRFRLDENKVNAFVNGTYTAQQYADDLRSKGTPENVVKDNLFVASGIQDSLMKKHIVPVMRVFYNRTAFQIPGDQRLRISLDTDLTFIREDEPRRRGNWRRPDVGIDYPFRNLPSSEAYKFPYAVLETKLQTHLGQEPPQWLTRLLESRLVYEVPRFSKYLHGASFFWNPRLPLLPWWLSQMELDIRNAKQPAGNFSGLSRSKSLKPLIDGKYRIGYLESQLERSSTLKRANSQKAQGGLARSVSNRLKNNPTSIITPSTAGSSRINAIPRKPVALADNPFDDPIWSQHDIPWKESSAGSSSTTPIRPDGRHTADFTDIASTDFLIGKRTPRSSSYTVDSPNKSTDRLNTPAFKENVSPLIDEEKGVTVNKKEKKKYKGGAQIEPKVFFANERTFINWLQFAAMILSLALTLLNFGDNINRITGGVFFGICFVFAFYAFGFSRWRAYRIQNKPHLRFDDVFGPVFLCVMLIAALTLNFVLRWRQPSSTTGYLGTNNTASAS